EGRTGGEGRAAHRRQDARRYGRAIAMAPDDLRISYEAGSGRSAETDGGQAGRTGLNRRRSAHACSFPVRRTGNERIAIFYSEGFSPFVVSIAPNLLKWIDIFSLSGLAQSLNNDS